MPVLARALVEVLAPARGARPARSVGSSELSEVEQAGQELPMEQRRQLIEFEILGEPTRSFYSDRWKWQQRSK